MLLLIPVSMIFFLLKFYLSVPLLYSLLLKSVIFIYWLYLKRFAVFIVFILTIIFRNLVPELVYYRVGKFITCSFSIDLWDCLASTFRIRNLANIFSYEGCSLLSKFLLNFLSLLFMKFLYSWMIGDTFSVINNEAYKIYLMQLFIWSSLGSFMLLE